MWQDGRDSADGRRSLERAALRSRRSSDSRELPKVIFSDSSVKSYHHEGKDLVVHDYAVDSMT